MLPRSDHTRMATTRCLMNLHNAIATAAKEANLSVEAIILCHAIQLGQLEGRPMDITALSAVTHFKFPTCHRYLKILRDKGIIEVRQEGKRQVHYHPTKLEDPMCAHTTITRMYTQMDRAIADAASDLSNLDNN